MRRLLLLRHGEALPGAPEGSDRDRPLSPHGRRSASAVAAYMEREGILPDLALCSTAQRARETLEPVCRRAHALETRFEDELYLASDASLASRLERLDAAASRVLLVGHNPGISGLALWLDPDARDRLRMPPAALAILALRVDGWSDLCRGSARLEDLVFAESLSGPDTGSLH